MASRPLLHRSLGALAACLALGWLAGCGGCGRGGGTSGGGEADGFDAGTPRRGGQVVVALSSDISGVNSVVSLSNTPTQEVLRHLFVQLLREQPSTEDEPPGFLPDLATAWEWSDDHKVLTFTLRDDAVWSDGVPVTAEDVRFSWQAQTSPEVAWDVSYMKDAIDDVEVVDPHTVRFHFDRVYSTQLLDANEDYVLPKHAWGELPFSEWRSNPDWFREHLVTGGPFLLADWKPQQQIVLARNPTYYDPELPRLDRVVIRIVPEQTSALAQFLSGDVDVVYQLAPDHAARVRADPARELISFWSRSYVYAGWNLRNPLFADRQVRLALTLGIDRQTLADSVWGEFGRVATSPIVAGSWGHDSALEPWPYDPERARRVLRDAGWTDHDGDGVVDKGGRRLAFELLTNAGNQQREDALVLIQDQLKRIGVAATPAVLEFQTFNSRVNAGQFEAVVSGWVMPTTLDNSYAFHSSEIGEGSNFVAYSDPETDRILDQIRDTPEVADTLPLLIAEQRRLHETLPYTFLWESKRLVGVDRRLHDVEPNFLFVLFNLPEWWLAEPAARP
jgi:peptide/nickel transport system substrate-binding protein